MPAPLPPCPACGGDGTVEVSDRETCRVPGGECCGGCAHMERCPACGGAGTGADEDTDDEPTIEEPTP